MRVGNDIVEVKRFFELLGNKRFLDRVFTKQEQEHIFVSKEKQKQAERMAGKFAAKESAAKALGLGIAGGVNFLNLVVLPDKNGAPTLMVLDEAKKIFDELGLKEAILSISNTQTFATSVCIMY